MSKLNSEKEFIKLGKSIHSWLMLNSSSDLYIENDENQDNLHHFNCGWNACRADIIETLFCEFINPQDDDDDDAEDQHHKHNPSLCFNNDGGKY